jgi:protein TonB
MAAYRQQKAQSAATKASPAGNKNQNLPQKTVNKIESAPVAAAPVLPQETPKLAENLNTNQSPIAANPENSATTVNNNQTTQSEVTAPTNQAKAEEKPVAIPTQKAKTGDLLPLSMVDVEPKIIKTVEPVYPDADRRLGIKGNVILNVLISENGEVLEAVVIRGIRGSVGVEKEAINAVKKWKFLPAEKDGVKVKVWKPITIGFGLNK